MSFEVHRNGTEPDVPTIALSQLGRLDAAIEKEFTLVSDRMTWMSVSESFIFGAFVTAAVSYKPGTQQLGILIQTILFILPTLGLSIAFLAHQAIPAAHTAADRLKERREKIEDMFLGALRVELVSSKLHTHSLGNLPPKYLPPIIMLVWVALLLVVACELLATSTLAAQTAIASVIIVVLLIAYFIRRSSVARIKHLEEELQKLKDEA